MINIIKIRYKFLLMMLVLFIGLLDGALIFAATTDGTYNITVDNIGFAGGEKSEDGTYDLFDTVSTPLVGTGNDGTYKTKDGFWYMVNNTISLELNSNTKDLGTVTPGTPNVAMTTATVVTDAPGGYDLLINKDHRLIHTNDGTTTINDYAGTISTPTAWSGVGLGFTVISGAVVESKWGVAPTNNYAGIPDSVTLFHAKSGYASGGDDTVIEYKIDVPSSQQSGEYTNTVTYTAISKL
jgi:hypothetical protein